MPTYGGMSPYPKRFGGGRPRVQTILDSLNQDRGTALEADDRDKTVYVNNMAIARAISAAWATNGRLGTLWRSHSMPLETLVRWEKMLALAPSPEQTMHERRRKVEEVFQRFGLGTTLGLLYTLLTPVLGDALVAVEFVDYSGAYITVPDGTYPWGIVVEGAPWTSNVARVLIRLQLPTGWSELDFKAASDQVVALLEPVLPVYTLVDWYRPGPISAPVSGGASAAGFYLDDDHNLDNELFDE